MKKYLVIFLFLSFLVLNLLPVAALAQNEILDGLIMIKIPLGLPSGDLRIVISNIINAFLGFVGILFTLIVLYAGFLYLFSMGDDTQTLKAKNTLTQGVIGLVIIFCSYSFVNFLINSIREASMQ
jgi:hypothetical protein